MLPGVETGMKRVVLLFLALLLLIDLADDGHFGKATFVAPQSTAKTSLISPLLDYSGTVDSRYTLPSDGWKISRLIQWQPVTLPLRTALKLNIYNHTSSSGGIPL